MDIGSLQNVGLQANSNNSQPGRTLDKNDFLDLLVTQLKNQDPLKPTDPTEFTEQLAQFSSLEQLYNIGESMQAIQVLNGSIDRLSALSLIDKFVTSESDIFQYQSRPVEIGFNFQDQVQKATVYIKNEAGRIVDQIDVDQPPTGENFFTWDGNSRNGEPLPDGKYIIEVLGTTNEGEVLESSALIKSQITGVDFSNSKILTNNGKVEFGKIVKVNNSTPESES